MNQEGAPPTESVSLTNFLRRYPEFLHMREFSTWQVSDVGRSFEYPQSVHHSKLYAFNGVFMELFMLKCLCTKFQIPCRDERTEKQLPYPFWNEALRQQRLLAYEAYVDPHRVAADIVDEIKIVALTQGMSYYDPIEKFHSAMAMEVDILNLEEIIRFVDGLNYRKFTYKEFCEIPCDNINLIGVPDYVFDDATICQVSTSMRPTLYPSKATKCIFYSLAHYCQNYFERNEEKQYTLIIYNPLLGKKHELRVNINAEFFTRSQSVIDMGVQNLS